MSTIENEEANGECIPLQSADANKNVPLQTADASKNNPLYTADANTNVDYMEELKKVHERLFSLEQAAQEGSNEHDCATELDAALILDFANDTTLHGFRYLFVTRGLRRIVWTIAFFVAGIFALYMVHGAVGAYFKHKTFINTIIDEDLTSLPFPTVTICIHDNFNKIRYKEFPGNITFDEYKRIFDVVHGFNQNDIQRKNDSLLFKRLNVSNYETLVRALHLNYHDVGNDTISRVLNHGAPCFYSHNKCTKDDLIPVWPMSGEVECQQFNAFVPGKPPRYQSKINDPFRIYFDVHTSSRYQIIVNGHEHFKTTRVYVHPYGTPHNLLDNPQRNDALLERAVLLPGYLTKVSVDRNEVISLYPPHGSCGKKDYTTVSNKYPYTINMCAIDCRLQYTVKKCRCIRFDLKSIVGDNIPICTTTQMIDCYIRENFNARKSCPSCASCVKTCPRECVRFQYNMNMERTILPRHHYRQLTNAFGVKSKNRTEIVNYINENVIGVEVGYRRMVETKQQFTKAITFTTLVGTVGGSIGLGMGLSVLTVVEFTMFAIDAIKFACIKYKNR